MKQFIKRNSRNWLFKGLSGIGEAFHKLYENRNHRVESNGELTVIKKIARLNPNVVVDGGANVGNYSKLLAEHMPSTKIYALEPVQNSFNTLEKNIAHWKLTNVNPIQMGLYSSNIEKPIHIYNSNTHSSLYEVKGVPYTFQSTQNIQLMRGDEFMEQENIDTIDFLKMDLEGSEYDALLGFESALKNGKIKCIQFEYGYINITTRKLLLDFYELLELNGYTLGKVYPRKVEFRPYKFKNEDFIGPNMIAVLKSEKQWIQLLQNK